MKKYLFFLVLFSLTFISCLDDRDSGSSNPTTISFDGLNNQTNTGSTEEQTNTGSTEEQTNTGSTEEQTNTGSTEEQTNTGSNTQNLTVDCTDKSYCVKHFNTDIIATNLTVTFNLGSNTKDVYAIFTNPTTSSFSTTATVSSKISNTLDIDAEFEKKKKEGQELLKTAQEKGLFLIGKPDLDYYRAHIDYFVKKNRRENSIRASSISKTIIGQDVGATHNFYVYEGGTVSATLKKQITAHDRTLNVWVDNDTFKTTCKENEADCITQAAIDKMAVRFLQTGSDNDIYEWITNIYGEEWGSLSNSNYISSDKNITILFYDIDNDNSADSGTVGYFNPADIVNGQASTNQTVMFYMDSAICQNLIGTGLSTLAHEFQHLIGFYQKIKQGASSSIDTWADEMSSMTAENFVNTKISAINDGSTITVNSPAEDRIPSYNEKNYLSLTTWYGGSDVYVSYGSSYAFGAYLARNYGGTQFFQNLIKNTSLVSGRDAVMYALNKAGCSDSFGVILQKWGASVLLSDKTDTASVLGSGYVYNNEKSSTLNSMEYTVEALNFYDSDKYSATPKIFEGSLSDNAGNNKESNAFYKVGSNLTGSFSKNFNINKGGYITFVVR